MIIVSACLAGRQCRYDGTDRTVDAIRKLVQEGKAVPVCPEVLGGLPVPREPSEICGERIISRTGTDVTGNYLLGAEKAMEICRKHGCTAAVLKEKSPACGNTQIYDGTFSGTLISGQGVFAAMLRENGIPVMTEETYTEEV